jgi:CheY-like chemotaxis protein
MHTPQKILVVEDMATQALKMTQVLKASGFQPSVAKSGEQALELLAADPHWDAIISDVKMPNIDGFELCKRVKNSPQTKDIPFVLLLSLADTKDGLEALSCGADNVMLKDYDKNYFIPHLLNILATACEIKNEPAVAGRVLFAGKWHEISAPPSRLTSFVLSSFVMAVHDKSTQQREVSNSARP